MTIKLRFPNIKGSDKEQLVQIRSYLYQLVEQLQYTINQLEEVQKAQEETLKKLTERYGK